MQPHVAFDIETTGLTAESEIAVIGTYDGDDARFYVQGEDAGPTSTTTPIPRGDDSLHVSWYSDEQTLLTDGLTNLISDWDLHGSGIDTPALVGFNAESRYSGGFDIPHLRTRCLLNGIEWPLAGVQILDIQDEMDTFFRTTVLDYEGFNKAPLKDFAEYLGADPDGSYKDDYKDAVDEVDPGVDELESFSDDRNYNIPTDSKRTLDGIAGLLTDVEMRSSVDGEDVPDKIAEGSHGHVIDHNYDDIVATHALWNVLESYVPMDAIKHDTL